MAETSYRFNGCRFDDADGRLYGTEPDSSLTLRPQAARLLVAFLERPGQVLDRKHLRNAIWEEGAVVDFESGLAALMRELRQALDDVGAGARLIETVPRRGYRFLGTVETQPDATASDAPDDVHQAPRAILGRPMAVAIVVLALLAVGMVSWWAIVQYGVQNGAQDGVSNGGERGVVGGLQTGDPSTLAIIPFEAYSGDAQIDRRLRLLLADRLLAQLWQVELAELDLIGRAALRPYQDREDQAAAVANDLGVSLLLEGSIIRPTENRWQVDARLLAMPRGTVLWSSAVRWDDEVELPVIPTVNDLVADLAEAWPRIQADLNEVSD